MGDKRAEVAAHDAMPGSRVVLAYIVFDGSGNFFVGFALL